MSCSCACLNREWMISVYKSQFSLQWRTPHTHAPSLCWKTLTAAAPVPEWAPRVCFSLKHFRSKSLNRGLFGVSSSSFWSSPFSSSSCWTELWRKEKRRVQLQFTPSLSAVICGSCKESWFLLLYFCCELSGTFLAVFKIWCRVHYNESPQPRWPAAVLVQISLGVWCYLHVIRAGNEFQLLIVIKYKVDFVLIGKSTYKD